MDFIFCVSTMLAGIQPFSSHLLTIWKHTGEKNGITRIPSLMIRFLYSSVRRDEINY